MNPSWGCTLASFVGCFSIQGIWQRFAFFLVDRLAFFLVAFFLVAFFLVDRLVFFLAAFFFVAFFFAIGFGSFPECAPINGPAIPLGAHCGE